MSKHYKTQKIKTCITHSAQQSCMATGVGLVFVKGMVITSDKLTTTSHSFWVKSLMSFSIADQAMLGLCQARCTYLLLSVMIQMNGGGSRAQPFGF